MLKLRLSCLVLIAEYCERYFDKLSTSAHIFCHHSNPLPNKFGLSIQPVKKKFFFRKRKSPPDGR